MHEDIQKGGYPMKKITISKLETEQTRPLFSDVGLTTNFWDRLKGLLGRQKLAENQGLLIKPCRQIHTFGMKFPIDVIFINREGLVVKVINCLEPGRQAYAMKAAYTLEVSAGMAKRYGLTAGDQLMWG